MPTYVGKAALTLVRMQHGSVEYVYGGHVAPNGILKEDLDRLVDEGFLVKVDDPAEFVAPDLVDDPGLVNAATGEVAGRPALAADKSAWTEFRRAEGVPDEALLGLTKAELQDDEHIAGLRPRP